MKYLAVTQQTAEWVLGRPVLRDLLHKLVSEAANLRQFRDAEIAEGSLRLAGSLDERVLALWNVDYLTNTGEEVWGFVKLSPPFGVFEYPIISREVFDRVLYVMNQRLQGLIIDTDCIHKSYASGAHSCLAGRGDDARQLSIGYIESDGGETNSRRRSIICVGPSRSYDALDSKVNSEAANLKSLCEVANIIISPLRRRPLLDSSFFPDLRDELTPQQTRKEFSYGDITTQTKAPDRVNIYRTMHWTYADWVAQNSPLSQAQRRILTSDSIKQHPIRLTGLGGSGKTLLMLLIATRLLKEAKNDGQTIKILYIAHNAQMMDRLRERFITLCGEEFFEYDNEQLRLVTAQPTPHQQVTDSQRFHRVLCCDAATA
jgi:hypothetical protein